MLPLKVIQVALRSIENLFRSGTIFYQFHINKKFLEQMKRSSTGNVLSTELLQLLTKMAKVSTENILLLCDGMINLPHKHQHNSEKNHT